MGVHYVFALPKSGSRWLLGAILDAQPDNRIPLVSPPNSRGASDAVNMELNRPFLASIDSGMLHSHAAALPANFATLRELGIRHLITIRHPADHLVALYCHLRRILKQNAMSYRQPVELTAAIRIQEISRARKAAPTWHNVIFPMQPAAFGDDIAVSDAIEHMIQDGYLVSALKWTADWLMFADELSLVVKFEDVAADTAGIVAAAYRHLRCDEPMSVPSALPRVEADPVSYPLGYSGSPGVWRAYFSAQNVSSYNAIAARFFDAYAPSRFLVERYPDWRLP